MVAAKNLQINLLSHALFLMGRNIENMPLKPRRNEEQQIEKKT